ncbi:putative nuclease HARBI1 isoform X3 [Anopheles funestus]|uniref:putative nuclease HARBI1 isoform 3 n=1 Tax=Anopheles funestus TaxID=62324 RepID=UPI0020C68AE5|nr:putative nuclease HARBI1 isoform 3 [Anopheles funestus]
MQILQSPQWARVLARVLAMNLVRRRRALAQIRQWWMRPIFIQRREAGNDLLDVIMQEQFTGATFNFLRMNNEDFEHLLHLVEPKIRKTDTNMRKAITSQERLLITLRYLATGDCFASLQYLFRVSVRSISRIIVDVCNALIQVLQEYVGLPGTIEEWLKVAQEFESRSKFPHVLGAMDGKHVPIRSPKHSGTEYYNYKGYNRIVLLAVCDANYNILYADVGCQGRVSDGGVFKNSSLYSLLENKCLNISAPQILNAPYAQPVPFVLLGDKAFAMTEYLIRPFAGTHARGSVERTFNTLHSRARSVIENVFGILSSRFRVLVGPIQLEPEFARLVVLTTVYLHNFLRSRQPTEYMDLESNSTSVIGSTSSSSNGMTTVLDELAGIQIRSSNDLKEMSMRFANYLANK